MGSRPAQPPTAVCGGAPPKEPSLPALPDGATSPQPVRRGGTDGPTGLPFGAFGLRTAPGGGTIAGMPRPGRGETGGLPCHVLNRGNGHGTVLRDHADGELARRTEWLMTSHVRRYHARHATRRDVWQGPCRSSPVQRRQPSGAERARGLVQTPNPLWRVVPYVDPNPLRAKLVRKAEDCAWSLLGSALGVRDVPACVSPGWLTRPAGSAAWVNGAESAVDLAAVARSSPRARPFGRAGWRPPVGATLGLVSKLHLRARRRPEKHPQAHSHQPPCG